MSMLSTLVTLPATTSSVHELVEIGEVGNSDARLHRVAVRERVDLGAERGDPVAACACDPLLCCHDATSTSAQ
jgi:hypothetical protein